MKQYTPTGITANRTTKEMRLTWADGHTSVLSFGLLRNACPCAECAGGHENMKSEPDPEVFFIPLQDSRANDLVSIEQMGNYAITIHWGDGHHYGIYRWEYLRKLDPAGA